MFFPVVACDSSTCHDVPCSLYPTRIIPKTPSGVEHRMVLSGSTGFLHILQYNSIIYNDRLLMSATFAIQERASSYFDKLTISSDAFLSNWGVIWEYLNWFALDMIHSSWLLGYNFVWVPRQSSRECIPKRCKYHVVHTVKPSCKNIMRKQRKPQYAKALRCRVEMNCHLWMSIFQPSSGQTNCTPKEQASRL